MSGQVSTGAWAKASTVVTGVPGTGGGYVFFSTVQFSRAVPMNAKWHIFRYAATSTSTEAIQGFEITRGGMIVGMLRSQWLEDNICDCRPSCEKWYNSNFNHQPSPD